MTEMSEMSEMIDQPRITVGPAWAEPSFDEQDEEQEPQQMELFCDGRLRMTDDEFSLTYEETEITGMEGTESQLSFRLAQPNLITMLRTGSVTTALVFEQGKRHTSLYQTPIMPFEVCVHTLKIENRLTEKKGIGGTLELDYVVEIRGAQAERCLLHLEVTE